MESEQRGRASRASSTSSLGREVRCGCQFYQSDSLLPERRARLVRPSSRMQQPSTVRCSEHEYEPIAPPPPPSLPHPAMAPVVRITDTDVMPVADSDDSIDDRSRLPPELTVDGDVVLPLDGKIEDSAMEGRELGGTGDTSEEHEPTSVQQLQERLEERFLDAPTPYTESRTDGEINTSQVAFAGRPPDRDKYRKVDSSTMEELPLRRGLPQRLKIQAGKLRTRLRSIQRPTFAFPQRQKKSNDKTTSSGKSDKSRTPEKRPSRMDRLRRSISEKSAKFSLPDRSKFHLPERPRFNFPDKSKFAIKKPNIRLPGALTRIRRPSSMQRQDRSTESTAGSRRNIFDIATYPRIFDRRSKRRGEYATSSPKDPRTQSAESATFPRDRKGKAGFWARPFAGATHVREQEHGGETAASDDGSLPWRRTSTEEKEIIAAAVAARAIPWEDARKLEERRYDDNDEEEIQYMDYEQELSSQEVSDRQPPLRRRHRKARGEKESREEAMEVDGGDEETRPFRRDQETDRKEDDATREENWDGNQRAREDFRPILKSRSLDGEMPVLDHGGYDGTFAAVDPRRFKPRKMASEEEEEEEVGQEEEEEEEEPSSARSDREHQQSSGSSCDRRRRGIIEEIDSDEFFLRERGISQDMNIDDDYLANEIRDALRSEMIGVSQDDEVPSAPPPQRPVRTRSLKRREVDSTTMTVEANGTAPPMRPKRKRAATAAAAAAARDSREASVVIDEVFRERTRSDSRSDSRHRVVYQAEGGPRKNEPLDDIVVVKPARRKSRSSLRSQSQPPIEERSAIAATSASALATAVATKPDVPLRKKRSHRQTIDRRNGNEATTSLYNGHRDWEAEDRAPSGQPATPRSSSRPSLILNEDGAVVMLSVSRENVDGGTTLDARLGHKASTPVPPKRRSRSRTTSFVADEDRTSHGADSLPEFGYIEDDIPQDEVDSAQDLPGYAIVEKRERPFKPPQPPRRRRKFATTPRPIPPKRPQRAYSTLGPASRSPRPGTGMSVDATAYIEIEDDDSREILRSGGGTLDKIQGRPLPAPPRPPRTRREHAIVERPLTPFEFATAETTTATQTDPLPDDMVIEEEVTQAKLVVMPSRSGSQVTVSMERVSTPSRTGTPPVPPLPISQFLQKDDEELEREREDVDARMAYDTMSLTHSPSPSPSPSPMREIDLEEGGRRATAPRHLEERVIAEEESRSRHVRSALLSDEPLRISSLEVGDLKVDRLSVSQIEAHKIVASEVDAMVIATSELRGGGSLEESLSPAIIKELMAIRSHLETMATSQARETYPMSEEESASRGISDVPTSDDDRTLGRVRREPTPEIRESSQERQAAEVVEEVESGKDEPAASTEDENPETDEDQKVVNTNALNDVPLNDRDKEVSHTLSVALVKESSPPQTLVIDQLEFEDKCKSTATTHLFTVTAEGIQDTQDKSLRILDSEHPLILSAQTTSDSYDESRASLPSSSDDVSATRSSESRASPERVSEPSSMSVQTTIATATATTTTTTTVPESTTTSATACLHGSTDDIVSDNREQTIRKSRSRSSSLGRTITRQTASPVRSLPPVISVTPDTPDSTPGRGISVDAQPQRAVISFSSDAEDSGDHKDAYSQRAIITNSFDTGRSLREGQRESSRSPVSPFPPSTTHFIAFPATEIPARFFSLNETLTNRRAVAESEPGILDTTQQLVRALRAAGIKAMRHFVSYLTSRLNASDTREKVREVELAICALLLFIAGLLIYYFNSSQTVTHYHHWDYFNPPQ